MRRTHIIHHTADKGICITASSLDELFRGALEGMANIQLEEPDTDGFRDLSKEIQEQITLQAPDRTALLIDFLSDVHTLSDIHGAVFSQLRIDRLNDQKLKATISGKKVESFDEDIKAVTHSQAEIITNEEGLLETIIVFDM